ncbi:MAG: hypothetical protein ABIB43_00645 [archaeon]
MKKQKSFSKKGQAALEFLTTYGWAFLIILVMIGALAYFGILNPERFMSDRCVMPAPFVCKDSVVTPNEIKLLIQNDAEAIVIVDGSPVTLYDEDLGQAVAGTYTIATDCDAINNGCRAGTPITVTITLNGDRFPENEKQKVTFGLEYYNIASGVAFTKSVTGEFIKTVESLP